VSPGEREFGELIGEVKALGTQLSEMQRRNSDEHTSVIQRLDGLRADLDRKAPQESVRGHELRIDSLEKTRDEGSGAARLVRVVQGAGVLGLMLLTYLASRGGP